MQTPNITDLEARLREAGVSVAAVCRRADMSQSTWWRWREGRSKPTPRMWARVEAALPEQLRGNA